MLISTQFKPKAPSIVLNADR